MKGDIMPLVYYRVGLIKYVNTDIVAQLSTLQTCKNKIGEISS